MLGLIGIVYYLNKLQISFFSEKLDKELTRFATFANIEKYCNLPIFFMESISINLAFKFYRTTNNILESPTFNTTYSEWTFNSIIERNKLSP